MFVNHTIRNLRLFCRGKSNFFATIVDKKANAYQKLLKTYDILGDGNTKPITPIPDAYITHKTSIAMSELSVNDLDMLANSYYVGNSNTPKDLTKAIDLWKRSAQLGSITGSYQLAALACEGKHDGIDIATAIQTLHSLARDHNHGLSQVCCLLYVRQM